MKYSIFTMSLVTVGGLLLGQLSGCTAIGYGIGSAIDSHNRVYREKPICAATTVEDGNKIRVTADRDTIFEGKFGGIVGTDENEYAFRYQAPQGGNLPGSIIWPDLGDSVVFHLGSGDTIAGPFAGYDLQFGKFCRHPETEDTGKQAESCCRQFHCGLLGSPGDSLRARVFLKDIEWIKVANDDTLGGKVLNDMAQAGLLPLRSMVAIDQGGLRQRVPAEKVTLLESMETGNARWYGFGIGVTIDAAIIGIAIGLAIALSDSGGFGLN